MSRMKLAFGVHNDEYNLDYYEDGHLEIYRYDNNVGLSISKLITTFDVEIVALFVSLLKRDGHLDRLLEIDRKRLEAQGFTMERQERFKRLHES